MITEIRIYKLKENTATGFNTVFMEQSLPMMKRWKVNVVDYGFSLIDKDSFYLIRNYDNLEQRKVSQDAFYGSGEWINGPEKAIMGCIETYNTSVVDSGKLKIETNETNR
ncbi:MAG: NIPSNAP family protein [Salinivirgaceae bacterium]